MRLFLVAALAILTVACSTTEQFSLLSTSTFNFETISGQLTSLGPTQGTSCQGIILGFYTGGAPKLDAAIHDALARSHADVLANASVRWSLVFPVLAGQECWIVKGDAYDTFE